MRRRVSVIGGGPAGLMAARLLARDHGDWEVTVYERLPPSSTFGFGVGLTRGLLAAVRAAAPSVHDALVGASAGFSSAAFQLGQGTVELPSSHVGAISRARLLEILLDQAISDGVRVVLGAAPKLAEVGDADLVIAADGVSSSVRETLAPELEVRDALGRGLFVWCGADVALQGTVFMPVRTEAGVFVAHAYPYAQGRSTFVIETDAGTLGRAGCRTESFNDDAESDEHSLRYLSAVFRDLLHGAAFVGNRSRWMHFRTVSCRSWHHERVVLLGDAAATAHPSLGSGTKMALESAIGLAESMRDIGVEHPASRLEAFERAVRPNVERLQDLARRSQLWWESFPLRLDLAPAQIAFAYLSRAGAVSFADLQQLAPELAGRAAAEAIGVTPGEVPGSALQEWLVSRPVQWNGGRLLNRVVDVEALRDGLSLEVEFDDPWAADVQPLIERVRVGPAERPPAVVLTGRQTRLALLDRLALGERLRGECGARVAVSCTDESFQDAVDGIVAGRVDVITLGGER